MSFTDPQILTLDGTAYTLPRVASGANAGGFKTADGTTELTVSSSYGRRTRRTIRVTQKKIAADPFVAGASREVSMSTYVVVDVPLQGFTVEEQQLVVDALVAFLDPASGKVTQLLGGEN